MARRLLFKERSLEKVNNSPVGFKWLGFAGSTFSLKDSNGEITDFYADSLISVTGSAYGVDGSVQFKKDDNLQSSSLFKYKKNTESLQHGFNTNASGLYSHAEGYLSIASGTGSHAEGRSTIASGEYSHAEGEGTIASGIYSHAEGEDCVVTGRASFVAGEQNVNNGDWSFAIGRQNKIRSGVSFSFVAGFGCTAASSYSFAAGFKTITLGDFGFSIGQETIAGENSFTSGTETYATASSHAEGRLTKAYSYGHSEGVNTIAGFQFVEEFFATSSTPTATEVTSNWYNTSDNLLYSWNGTSWISQNDQTISIKVYNTTNGVLSNLSVGNGYDFSGYITYSIAARFNWENSEGAHSEGTGPKAIAVGSHAEGRFSETGGRYSHAEGGYTRTGRRLVYGVMPDEGPGQYAHAEGYFTWAEGYASHAEGYNTWAIGTASHAQGLGTIAEGDYQSVLGRYNDYNTYSIVIIGNGSSNTNRSTVAEFNIDSIVFKQPLTASNIESTGTVQAASFVGNGSGLTDVPGTFITGAGSPEGNLTASIGTVYINTSGGSGQTLWVKELGIGNTGWAGK
jgi:hypothetical protein